MATTSLIGNYQHTIDAKGRLFIPSKQREALGDTVYMTRGLDDCVFLFSKAGWEEFVSSLDNLSMAKARVAVRYFGGNAAESELDAQGRISLPSNLRKICGLDKDVTVVGVLNRLEIWDTAKWESFNNDVSDNSVSDVLEELGF